MRTQQKKILMVYIKTNIIVNRTHIQGRIEYVDNNVNTEPGIAIDTYYGKLYNYVGNTVDTQPEDLYETYPGEIQIYEILNVPKNTNMQEDSYDKISRGNPNNKIPHVVFLGSQVESNSKYWTTLG